MDRASNKKVRKMIVGTIILCMAILAINFSFAQQPRQPQPLLTVELLRNYLNLPEEERKTENKRFMEMYDGLRVADVRDGMDWFGYIKYAKYMTKI